MDPITLNKLLSVADALANQARRSSLSIVDFDAVISKTSKAKNLRRRAQDILRVCQELEWITEESQCLTPTDSFTDFVTAWDAGDLLIIGRALSKYSPYSAFLDSLRKTGDISLAKADEGGTKVFVALDTFRSWAVACAQAHVSPFDECLHWGGAWDENSPSLDAVLTSIRNAYQHVGKTGGFADLGRIADSVCRGLHIAFQVFESKVTRILKSGKVPFILAPATIRAPSRRFRIATIRPRSAITADRRTAQFMAHIHNGSPTQWLEYRYLEDGLRINGQLMKLLKWEASRDPQG